MMSEAFIISAVRTPVGVGKEKGALYPVAPVDLAAMVMAEAVSRAVVNPSKIDDVVWGCVTPIGDQGANLARLAVLKAGFPAHVPAVTLNRMCGSGQQAVHFAAQAIMAGDMDLVVAGGWGEFPRASGLSVYCLFGRDGAGKLAVARILCDF